MNTSLIKTAKGLTITVKHAVSTPHPYDRINLIAGTKALFQDYPPRIYIDGMNKDESFGSIDAFKQYQHPLWKREATWPAKTAATAAWTTSCSTACWSASGGLAPDLDVYDAASWSAVAPLSVASVGRGSAPVEFPDFTRGKWKQRSASAIATQQ